MDHVDELPNYVKEVTIVRINLIHKFCVVNFLSFSKENEDLMRNNSFALSAST